MLATRQEQGAQVAGKAISETVREKTQSMADRTAEIPAILKEQASYDAAVSQAEVTVTAPVGTPENPSDRIFTVANFITLGRFVLTMAFLALFVSGGHRVLALTCYVIAAITDFLDGMVARRTQTVSWLGKVMDPIMDRVLLFTGVIGLLATGELPVWVVVFVIGRDLGLAFGAHRLRRYQKRPLDVLFVGKLATAFLMFGFCVLLLGWWVVPGLGIATVSWLPGLTAEPVSVGIFFVYVGIALSSIAAISYLHDGFAIKREYLIATGERKVRAK